MLHSDNTGIKNEFYVLDKTQSMVLRTLMYFQTFRYPLTLDEIFHYTKSGSKSEVQNAVASLTQMDLLGTLSGKYFLQGNETDVAHRSALNKRAAEYYAPANKFTKLISKFPFVRGILITGSLSKGCMEKNGDIDYLIITEPNRLWLCRTFLTAYKKLILLNSRKYFCVNYYLDSESLHIPDKNIFTATEISSAKPAYNAEVCEDFFIANKWIHDFYPNHTSENPFRIHDNPESFLKNIIEDILDGILGELADKWAMRLFIWRWKMKFKGEDQSRFEVNFRSRKNVSKHHPHGFQFKVLKACEENVMSLEKRFNVKLT